MFLSIGNRLREERERLGFSQSAIGAVGGVRKLAQLKYEQGERFPGADYLAALARIGVDTLYIITGERSTDALTAVERQLLEGFRSAPLAVKAAAIAAVTAGSAPMAQSFHGEIGQYVAGDITHNSPVTFNLGDKKTKE